METIGSAARSCNPEEMRRDFYAVSDGGYAQLLFDKFGKKRVEREIEEYLAFDFFPRFGGGIGMTRLEHAFIKQGLFNFNLGLNTATLVLGVGTVFGLWYLTRLLSTAMRTK